MRQIQITDQVYVDIERRAAAAGFATVDDYVLDLLQFDAFESTDELDHLFTPERISHIDRATEEIKSGRGHSADEVREHFRRRFGA